MFVMRRFPRPLLDALYGQLPAAAYRTIVTELERRTPQQLADRVERRWFGRWAHALRQKDEDGRPLWTANDIACYLVVASSCPVPDCEDGMLIRSDTACQQCNPPEHRFVPASGPASSEGTRRAALSAMRDSLRVSPHRTGAAANSRATRPARNADPESMDRALARARARRDDPNEPRLTAPPPREEPGPEDSVILAARAARITEEQDPVRLAAVARARADRAARRTQGT
ncbi:hypothetical protein ACIOMM_30735 [Streptomyces sp. NPDC087908]|uniref:hypothetical protein n=1 Tax=Streptomyces sp. NPDC087908 TaxID=3365820 RepID=UPI0038085DE6